jgi:hypothetical protein
VNDSTSAMTCAGLLGLGVGHGVRQAILKTQPVADDPKARPQSDPGKDRALAAGLRHLATVIGKSIGQDIDPRFQRLGLKVDGKTFYLLFSIERIAVAFGLETIGNRDWFAWGSDVLVLSQQPDGTWKGEYGADVDSSFALLFLRKGNLTPDLSVSLRGKVKDPQRISLKSRGDDVESLDSDKGLRDRKDPIIRDAPRDLKDEKKPLEDSNPSWNTKPAATDAEAVQLGKDLVEGSGAKKERAFESFRNARGSAFTRELASAIARLEGVERKKARELLADRLSRMTADTLDEKLQDDNLEIRRAAAIACALKEEKSHLPRLIAMLADSQPAVGRAAFAALKSLTGQDFGPRNDASPIEVEASVKAWNAWWSKNK